MKKSASGFAGFTLIEILLCIATIAIIAGLSIPIYLPFQTQNDLDITATGIIRGTRRAQTLAQAVDGDTSWGIKIQSGSMTVFKGTNYAARATAFDEVLTIQPNITPSGLSEIVFTKFTGLPQTTGTITLTSTNNSTKNISINAKGTIGY
jgi:type II secretory pathway pseudopilin PulG